MPLPVYNKLPFTMAIYIGAIFLFLKFFINTVVFDMRDEIADKKYNVPTIPVILGKVKTMYLLLIINTAAGLLLLYSVMVGWLPSYVNFLNLITLYGYYFIFKSNDEKTNQRILCDVITDGKYILWPFLLLIGKLMLGV